MRVVILGGLSSSLINFRGELLRSMVANGHQVLATAAEDDSEVRAALAAMGVQFVPIPLNRASISPLRDLAYIFRLTRLLLRYRPDLTLAYTAKPVIFGSLSAFLARVQVRAAIITGVGSALGDYSGSAPWLRRVMEALYRLGLGRLHVVLFQNPDDEAMFRKRRLVSGRQRVERINGSGVNLDHFPAFPLPPRPPTVLLMIARLLRDKGVREFAEAARLVSAVRPDVRFRLLGGLDPNPTSITPAELARWVAEGLIEYLGSTNDVRPYLRESHVFVLPSYGEGTPRSTLEALATGRPVVTTDAPGCRQTVCHGVNGFLAAPRSGPALASAILACLDSVELAVMGKSSRALAEARFDVHQVNDRILECLGLRSSSAIHSSPTTSLKEGASP